MNKKKKILWPHCSWVFSVCRTRYHPWFTWWRDPVVGKLSQNLVPALVARPTCTCTMSLTEHKAQMIANMNAFSVAACSITGGLWRGMSWFTLGRNLSHVNTVTSKHRGKALSATTCIRCTVQCSNKVVYIEWLGFSLSIIFIHVRNNLIIYFKTSISN